MPQIPGNKLTVPQKMLDLFRGIFGDDFHGYYEGDPIIPPQSMMPCLIISEPETGYDTGPTGMDQVRHQILIQIVFNKKDDIGKPDNAATLENKVDTIAQGRDESSGQFLTKSFMHILRNNLTLDNLMVDSVSTVRKGVVPRSETLMTVEAHIEVTLSELVAISNRV